MRALELKVPPLAVMLCAGAAMWLAAAAAPALTLDWPFATVAAGALALAGLAVALAGVLSFRRARTTVNPVTPGAASALVTSGIYRLTRNPMYLGFALVLLAWAVFLGNVLALVLLPAFVLYIDRFQIEPEERVLSALFGEAFVAYTTQVRRWL
ncbi:MAG TPA: isoprenylcysteine carboxylmethyltransferase family protein [Albitalea sp.]